MGNWAVTAEPEPHLTDAEVQESMGLEGFFQKHDGLGDPHPDETRRLIAKRRAELEDLRSSQAERRRRLADADARLHAEIDAICGR